MTPLFSLTRFSSLFLLAAALLSSCAKEVPAPGPAPARTTALADVQTTTQNSTASQLLMSTSGSNAFAPGRNLNLHWSTGLPPGQQPGPEVATSVTVEFQRNGVTVVRALDQPVTVFDDPYYTYLLVPYSIPSMLDPDTYTIVVHPSDPSKSLVSASSPQAYVTSLANPLSVSPNPGTYPVDGGPQLLLGGFYSTSFPLHWPSQGLPTTAVRIYMIDSAGLIYDPGQYSQRVSFPTGGYSLTYTDNDGSEQVTISQVPNGRYVFQVGSVDANLNMPDAYYVSAGGINIYNSGPGGPAPGPGGEW